MLGKAVVLEVAGDEAQLDLGGVALDEHRVHVSLASRARLGRKPVLRQPREDLVGNLDRVHELTLGPAGMDRAAMDAHAHLRGGERLRLQLARRGAVDRVGGCRTEGLDRKMDDGLPQLGNVIAQGVLGWKGGAVWAADLGNNTQNWTTGPPYTTATAGSR